MTSAATISEVSCAVRPAISLFPWSEIGPWTRPSICRSSSPEIWPLISMVEPKNDTLRATAVVGRMAAVGLAGVTGAPGRGVEDELSKLGGEGLLVNMVPPCFDPELGFSRQRATYTHFRRLGETDAILINRAVVRFGNCPSEQVEWNGNHSSCCAGPDGAGRDAARGRRFSVTLHFQILHDLSSSHVEVS